MNIHCNERVNKLSNLKSKLFNIFLICSRYLLLLFICERIVCKYTLGKTFFIQLNIVFLVVWIDFCNYTISDVIYTAFLK